MHNTREKLIELICSTEYGNGSLIGNNFQKGFIEKIADHLIANGVTVQEWKPISEPPKETGHYLVNIHQEDEEKGEQADFVLDAWYEVNGILFVPKSVGWTLLNEWYDLTAQMLPFVTHWTEKPQPLKGE